MRGTGVLPAVLAAAALCGAQDRGARIRNDRAEHGKGAWVYNDLPKGIAEARRTGKPLMVVLRCIP